MSDLEQIAGALMDITDAPYYDSLYTNRYGVQGYTATYRVSTDWYWYSVSGTTKVIPPHRVATAVKEGLATRANIFKLNGTEATIEHDSQWFMVNKGSR